MTKESATQKSNEAISLQTLKTKAYSFRQPGSLSVGRSSDDRGNRGEMILETTLALQQKYSELMMNRKLAEEKKKQQS